MNSRVLASASTSFSKATCATPDLEVCVCAPPSCSWVISSCVTDLTTSGPVTKRYEESLTMNVKSVMAGEYTAPPEIAMRMKQTKELHWEGIYQRKDP